MVACLNSKECQKELFYSEVCVVLPRSIRGGEDRRLAYVDRGDKTAMRMSNWVSCVDDKMCVSSLPSFNCKYFVDFWICFQVLKEISWI